MEVLLFIFIMGVFILSSVLQFITAVRWNRKMIKLEEDWEAFKIVMELK